ncbi:MAG: hypothetical protein ACJAT2_003089 [Bacteriovoracaceae bacterium]|jgi:hypothetical protein
MKSAIIKGAVALSVLGFTFGSNVVYESSWQPSIFRTIANAVTVEALSEENLSAEFEKLKGQITKAQESQVALQAKLDNEEIGLSELLVARDEKMKEFKEISANAFDRVEDFKDFIKGDKEHALFSEVEALSPTVDELFKSKLGYKLNQKISRVQERELLEQKAAIASTNEKLCENKGLLEDIKAQIAGLLKDKEEVVAEVEGSEEEAESAQGFSTDVSTYADFFSHIQAQQRSFFEMSPPSFMAPTNNPMAMFMMMSMFKNQGQAPRSQVNTYYMNSSRPDFSQRARVQSSPAFGGFSLDNRTPAAENFIPRLMPSFDGLQYTRSIPTSARINGLQSSILLK